MGYTDLLKAGADAAEIQEFLVGGETSAITIRLPQNLRDSAKEAAALQSMSFSTFVRRALLQELTKGR